MAEMENGILSAGVHINWDFRLNFWKISGFLYTTVFCAAAVIGDLILRGISGQGFALDMYSFIWMMFAVIIMGALGAFFGWILWTHKNRDPVIPQIISAVAAALVISLLFIYDVSYIGGKFVALNENKVLSCETNSQWINPFETSEIRRFASEVTASGPVNGNNLFVSVPISQNGLTLYRRFRTQDSLTAYIKSTVESDTREIFQFQLE